MNKYIFLEYSPEQRLQMLEDNADKHIDNFKFTKHLTPSELDEYREAFAEKHIELSEAKNELKAVTDLKKAEMKPIENTVMSLQKAIKERAIEVEETVFLMPDYDNNEMGYYNSEGELVLSRRLKPEERQTNIHSLTRKIS